MKNILITGGTGMVGSRLSEMLKERGYKVTHLSRRQNLTAAFPAYAWDIAAQTLDDEAILNADAIVHLAGSNIAETPWTEAKRKDILDSRIKSSELLYSKLKTLPHKVKVFVAASATGIYGIDTGDKWLHENETPADGAGFPAMVTRLWENATQHLSSLPIRLVTLRIGIVMSTKGGALPQMSAPVRYGFGAALASGKQYTPWIHIDDLCEMFIQSIENNSYSGTYNAVAPEPVSNYELTQEIAKALHRPLWLPNVPLFALRIIAGDMADVVAGSNRVSSEKIEKQGFMFKYRQIKDALKQLFA
jgi:hypothetical protein